MFKSTGAMDSLVYHLKITRRWNRLLNTCVSIQINIGTAVLTNINIELSLKHNNKII